jgi:hypothetical protein
MLAVYQLPGFSFSVFVTLFSLRLQGNKVSILLNFCCFACGFVLLVHVHVLYFVCVHVAMKLLENNPVLCVQVRAGGYTQSL